MCMGACLTTGSTSWSDSVITALDGTGWTANGDGTWDYTYSVETANVYRPGVWEYEIVYSVISMGPSPPDPVFINLDHITSSGVTAIVGAKQVFIAGPIHDPFASFPVTWNHTQRICLCGEFRFLSGFTLKTGTNPTPESWQQFDWSITATRIGNPCDPIV